MAFRGLGVGRVGQGVVQLSLLLEDHLEVVERAAGDRLSKVSSKTGDSNAQTVAKSLRFQ